MEKMRQYLILYYGINFAEKITNKESDLILETPETIHYKFVKLNSLLLEIRSGDSRKIKEAQYLLKKNNRRQRFTYVRHA